MDRGDVVIGLLIATFLGYIHFVLGGVKSRSHLENGCWAEETLSSMTLEEKIGQTLMPLACFDGSPEHRVKLYDAIKQYNIGGLLLFQYDPQTAESAKKPYDPAKQVAFLNGCQELSKYPLLISADAEYGLGMRFHQAMTFPKCMTLGAITNPHLIYEVGKEFGRQCRMVGIHINFAPVLDVNANPKNPIIGSRAFGDDEAVIAAKANLYIQGMKQYGVMACVKHFPGHGDTVIDSHKALPILHHSQELLWKRDLVPFKETFKHGVDSVMVGHLYVPALQGSVREPATLSSHVVTHLLKRKMGFSGLVFTDALAHMKAITDYYQPGEAEVKALKAGVDVLVDITDVKATVEKVKDAVAQGFLTEAELDTKVLKILRAKESMLLNKKRITKIPSPKKLFTPYAYALRRKLYENAMTLMTGNNVLVNHITKQAGDMLLVSVGSYDKIAVFKKFLPSTLQHSTLSSQATDSEIAAVERLCLDTQKMVVFALFPMQNKFGLAEDFAPGITEFLHRVTLKKERMIAGIFANPYILRTMPWLHRNVIVAYEDDADAMKSFLSIVNGKMECHGSNPVSHTVTTMCNAIDKPMDRKLV